jgi:hypothetical protein
MAQPRCPVCNRWGNAALGGYCKNCHPNTDDDDKNVFDDFPSSFDGEFFPERFGIIKDKFGYER